MKSKELVNLVLSPHRVAKLLHHFLCGAQKVDPKGIKTELLYLSLPFIIDDDDAKKKLLAANSRSTLASAFKSGGTLEIKNALSRKNTQAKQYREFVNRGLICLGNIETLKIGKFITADKTIEYQQEKGINRDYCKVAYYLGVIFAKEDYRNIFVKLGVTNI